MNNTKIPKDFAWGTATASFQIEGATREDGRGESIWDRFASIPGAIITGETGDPACESYHRYREDIALMQQLGVNAYRFSVAWPRIIPEGVGRTNAAGLDYYDRVVDGLLAAGITPYVTLYHWDLPQALQDKGGWTNRTIVDAFVRYTEVVVARLGDRVKHWFTHNEPIVIAFAGHERGEHAPGLHDRRTAVHVSHHLLLSHGAAVPVIRELCPGAQVTMVINFNPSYPATESEADRRATELHHAKTNLWFLDPVMGRGYPEVALQHYGTDRPPILPGDMETIAAPIDGLGVNFYRRIVVHDPAGGEGGRVLNRVDDTRLTARDYEMYPQALHSLLTWLHQDYALPKILITENGAAFNDVIAPDGRIHDAARIDYLREHLGAVLEAIDEGVPVQGYFLWSLLDNFEWAFGTSSRFGLVYIDFASQQRVMKDSGLWYGRVVRANALVG